MSHYHCEIVMPPQTTDVHAAVTSIMAPFDENAEEARHAFWDWWQIGGRYSGDKRTAKHPAEKLEAFYAWMKERGVTVSGLQWGKQELSPADQIPIVDAKWQEMFGEAGACPLFKHSNKTSESLDGDICPLSDAIGATCYRLIVAGPSLQDGEWTGPLEAEFMISTDTWNGVTWVKTAWDGKIATGIQMARDRLECYKDEYKAKMFPQDDWLTVTVDYHS